MLKTLEEIKEIVKERNITHWHLRDCSLCGYPCGYVIQGDAVGYDVGCDCSWGGVELRSWEELTESFNRNQPENNPDFFSKNPEAYQKMYAPFL